MSTLEQILAAQATFIGRLKSDLDDLMTREYGYTHEAIVTDDLEKDYQSIITETPSLANVSAVGMLAVLKDGDTVTPQGNRLFINGEEVLNPNGYTFSGTNSQNGIEIVKIWYFQNGSNQLTLQESFDYIIVSANVRQIEPTNIDDSYLDYIKTITINDFSPPVDNTIQNVIDNYGMETTLPYSTKRYFSDRSILGGSASEGGLFRGSRTTDKIEEAILPELIEIRVCSFWSSRIIKNAYFPKLKKIENNYPNNPYNSYYCPISGCTNLFLNIPESCEDLIGICFKTPLRGIILNCKEANIDDSWFYLNTVNDRLQIFELCQDWAASINISKAALCWNTKQKFIDCLNSLRNMTLTNETRTLTIPSAMLTELQADTDGAAAIAAANAKGWTIGGA